MCGIAGLIDFAGQMTPERKQYHLNEMIKSMSHRGPDDQGTYVDDNVRIGLAHTRLSIVDLSDTGSQPMHDADRGTHLVFNGEIYNHQELRSLLIEQGVSLIGTSDTEVLLKWLSLYGTTRMDALDGMFAFCF